MSEPSAALRQKQPYETIYNSLVCRLPSTVKSTIAPSLLARERLDNALPGFWWYPYFVARWYPV